MLEPLSQILSSLKLPTRAFAAVFFASLVILLLPAEYLLALKLDWLQNSFWPGLALILSLAFVLVDGLRGGLPWLNRRLEARAARIDRDAEAAADLERGLQFLGRMTATERYFCRKFIENEARTCWLDMEHGTVTELVRRGVIYQSNQHVHVDLDFQSLGAYFTIHDWAWEHLRENPNLVDE